MSRRNAAGFGTVCRVARLDFQTTSGLNGSVSSLNADAVSAGAFVTTHSSVVLAAQDDSRAAQEAREKLWRIYWWSV
jgi:hypothetical protein